MDGYCGVGIALFMSSVVIETLIGKTFGVGRTSFALGKVVGGSRGLENGFLV